MYEKCQKVNHGIHIGQACYSRYPQKFDMSSNGKKTIQLLLNSVVCNVLGNGLFVFFVSDGRLTAPRNKESHYKTFQNLSCTHV